VLPGEKEDREIGGVEMFPSDVAMIEDLDSRVRAYKELVQQDGYQDSLAQRITCRVQLTEKEQASALALFGKGCRAETKQRLRFTLAMIQAIRNHGIFNRVLICEEAVSYCAGQDYPSEVALVRDLLLGRK
jgi:hypothetical protein